MPEARRISQTMCKRCAMSPMALCVTFAFSIPGCGGVGQLKPTAALSSSIATEAEFRGLASRWLRATGPERVAMEPALTAFCDHHPDDALAANAEALLAWVSLEERDFPEARLRARKAQVMAGAGTVADFARVTEGVTLRREGRPKEALFVLLPLVNKIIDGPARALLGEEVVRSAMDAKQWERALDLVRVWLRNAEPQERAHVRERIQDHLTRIPVADLALALDRLRGAGVLQRTADGDILAFLAQRLAAVARETRDSSLAEYLLDKAGTVLGEEGKDLSTIAASAKRARVEARTVGLVLSLRTPEVRARGAEVASGVAFGLGLPGSGAHLVSRDDHGSREGIAEALVALSADGASILIAGSDQTEATAAAAFAEAQQIPVLLLRPPVLSPGVTARFSYVVGVDPDEVEAALVGGLVSRGAAPIALVDDDPRATRAKRPEITVVRGCEEAPPPAGVASVILTAGPDCARQVMSAPGTAHLRVAAGFGLDTLRLPPGSLVAAAGLFPIADPAPPTFATWIATHGTKPSFWAALGRDAAIIAWAGVQALPAEGTEDPREVTARRASAAAALGAGRAQLWTTEATGFGDARSLARSVRVGEQK